MKKDSSLKEYTYFVRGMHCASCETLIEAKILKEKNILAVEASTERNELRIEYKGTKPSIQKLNSVFKENNYTFFEKKDEIEKPPPLFQIDKNYQLLVNKEKFNNFLTITFISLLIIIGFLFLNRSGLAALISVNSQSTLPAFFAFGLLAGFSTCSALVGGIILSMSKQWQEIYNSNDSAWQKFQPHFLFNIARLISFTLLGALLGGIGSVLKISLTFTSMLTILVSIMMLFLSLQMLGVKGFRKFQFTMPKFVTRFVANENNFKGRSMPFMMGFLTFLLPCGFTITSQGLALIAGNPLQGALIMFSFSLGTLPALLMIGLSSIKFSKKPHLANRFLKIAGVLVLFFAFYNINAQFNVLGLKNINDLRIFSDKTVSAKEGLPPIINGKQVIKMDALAYGYEPNRLKVRKNIPVRWEITDKGTSGCTNAIISKGLFDDQIDLQPGTTSIKEFTPTKTGTYKFSCWMGMVSGIIEVVEQNGQTTDLENNTVVDSGAQGCGCGGSSSSCSFTK